MQPIGELSRERVTHNEHLSANSERELAEPTRMPELGADLNTAMNSSESLIQIKPDLCGETEENLSTTLDEDLNKSTKDARNLIAPFEGNQVKAIQIKNIDPNEEYNGIQPHTRYKHKHILSKITRSGEENGLKKLPGHHPELKLLSLKPFGSVSADHPLLHTASGTVDGLIWN